MKRVSFFVLMAFMLFLTSCGNKVLCHIDNPTDKEMKVSIDGKEVVLAPKEYKKLDDISVGEHKMAVDGGQEQTFAVEKACVINPAGIDYVIWAEEYSITGTNTSHLEIASITVNGKKYKGPFEVRNGNPVLYSDINYNVMTDFPKESEVSGSQSYVIRKKMYRADDFVADPVSQDYLED